jgi:hypothetical protein
VQQTSQIISRITTLWAATECGLGGFFHAMQSPFTGLIVGGLSVVYISLIAHFTVLGNPQLSFLPRFRKVSQTIFASVLFVLAIKAAVSPHSPIGAYFAVGLQALIGIVIYSLVRSHQISTLIVALLSMLSSALQKVLVMVVLFGKSLFDSIDLFFVETAQRLDVFVSDSFSLSESAAIVFLAIYAFGGLLIGYFASRIPSSIKHQSEELARLIQSHEEDTQPKPSIKKKAWFPWLIVLMISLSILVQFILNSKEAAVWQLARTLAVLIIWFLLFRPFVRLVLSKLKSSGKEKYQSEIATFQNELPQILSYSKYAWHVSKTMTGLRIYNWFLLFLFQGINTSNK